MFRELYTQPLPLPHALDATRPHRRFHAGAVRLGGSGFNDFIQLADELGGTLVEPLDADRLSSAARWLLDHHQDCHMVPCVRARMHIAAALRTMQAASLWELKPAAATLIERLRVYLDDKQHLIPTGLPVIGHLDDAILVDVVWPRLENELRDYLDYRELRRVEAELRGVAPARLEFSRGEWEQERIALRGLLMHFRRSGLGHYMPEDVELSRISVH